MSYIDVLLMKNEREKNLNKYKYEEQKFKNLVNNEINSQKKQNKLLRKKNDKIYNDLSEKYNKIEEENLRNCYEEKYDLLYKQILNETKLKSEIENKKNEYKNKAELEQIKNNYLLQNTTTKINLTRN